MISPFASFIILITHLNFPASDNLSRYEEGGKVYEEASSQDVYNHCVIVSHCYRHPTLRWLLLRLWRHLLPIPLQSPHNQSTYEVV